VAVRVCFGTLIAFIAYMVLSSTGPALASSYNFVAPVIGTVLGVSLGSETVTRDEWLAAAVVVVGVTAVVAGRGRRRRASDRRSPRAHTPSRRPRPDRADRP